MPAPLKELSSSFFIFDHPESLQQGLAAAEFLTLGLFRFDREREGIRLAACAFQHTGDDGFLPADAGLR